MTEPKTPPGQRAGQPSSEEGGFLSRWSRRKAQLREGQPLPSEPPAPVVPGRASVAVGTGKGAVAAQPAAGTGAVAEGAIPASTAAAPQAPDKPALTLADVDKLGADSNFAPFAARDVDPQVRNAAMKKLFHADPHFNVMDGLDVYIGDYHTPDPLPKAIMRTMLQARSLGLLDDELIDQDKPEPDEADGVSAHADTLRTHENADLQLQPDDAAGPTSAGGGAEPGPECSPESERSPDAGQDGHPSDARLRDPG